MTAQTKTTLKTYFNTGDQPTEEQFANFVDSIGFTPVPVTTNWSVAANVATDIEDATGMVGRSGDGDYLQLTLWEGSADPDDYASFYPVAQDGNPTWAHCFDSVPTIGSIVFIIGAHIVTI